MLQNEKRKQADGARLLALAAAGLLMLQGVAQAGPELDGKGLYLGASFGSAKGKSKVYLGDSDPSVALAVGYRFNPHLSAELFARNLNFNIIPGLFEREDYVYPDSHVGTALRLSAPLNESFQVYGRLGLGRTSMKATRVGMQAKSLTEASVGAGLGYDFNATWGLQLEYNRFLKNDINVLSLGVQLRF
ncbi:porin family protein [Paucibacter sp. B51]|uniref:porin family protein n=1 Tax=Paucibacter sp. B51 TaxID=2993315 RepID=UPI0022EBBB30|nr:porin family protein [Paucibacter sp. B51]